MNALSIEVICGAGAARLFNNLAVSEKDLAGLEQRFLDVGKKTTFFQDGNYGIAMALVRNSTYSNLLALDMADAKEVDMGDVSNMVASTHTDIMGTIAAIKERAIERDVYALQNICNVINNSVDGLRVQYMSNMAKLAARASVDNDDWKEFISPRAILALKTMTAEEAVIPECLVKLEELAKSNNNLQKVAFDELAEILKDGKSNVVQNVLMQMSKFIDAVTRIVNLPFTVAKDYQSSVAFYAMDQRIGSGK